MILVRVLMLLACGPLLLPSGFCNCQMVEACEPLFAQAESETDHSDDGSAPSDHDHCPGCPDVLKAVAPSPPVEPTADTPNNLALWLASVSFVPPVSASPAGSRFASISAPRSTASPLYVFHCALLI